MSVGILKAWKNFLILSLNYLSIFLIMCFCIRGEEEFDYWDPGPWRRQNIVVGGGNFLGRRRDLV